MRSLILMALCAGMAAAEGSSDAVPVPDPYGYGERLALMEWARSQGRKVQPGTDLETLRRWWKAAHQDISIPGQLEIQKNRARSEQELLELEAIVAKDRAERQRQAMEEAQRREVEEQRRQQRQRDDELEKSKKEDETKCQEEQRQAARQVELDLEWANAQALPPLFAVSVNRKSNISAFALFYFSSQQRQQAEDRRAASLGRQAERVSDEDWITLQVGAGWGLSVPSLYLYTENRIILSDFSSVYRLAIPAQNRSFLIRVVDPFGNSITYKVEKDGQDKAADKPGNAPLL